VCIQIASRLAEGKRAQKGLLLCGIYMRACIELCVYGCEADLQEEREHAPSFAYIPTHIHTYIHTHTLLHTITYRQAKRYAASCAYIHTYIPTCIYTHFYIYTHTDKQRGTPHPAYTYIHTYIHTHTDKQRGPPYHARPRRRREFTAKNYFKCQQLEKDSELGYIRVYAYTNTCVGIHESTCLHVNNWKKVEF
jgi:hypothetical protein